MFPDRPITVITRSDRELRGAPAAAYRCGGCGLMPVSGTSMSRMPFSSMSAANCCCW